MPAAASGCVVLVQWASGTGTYTYVHQLLCASRGACSCTLCGG